MTVAEFISWLQEFHDQGATVEIVVHEKGTGYYDQGGNATTLPFDPLAGHSEYTDLRGNPKDTRTLLLGIYDG